jgi:exopolysaccharide biosynthesis protein
MVPAVIEEEKRTEVFPEETVIFRRAFFPLLLFILLTPVSAPGEEAAVASSSVLGVRQCLGRDSVRIVLDCSSRPLCQVYQSDNSREVVVDLFEASAASGLPSFPEVSDSLIKSWEFSQPNFRQLTFRIKLKYAVPSENIRVFLLREPDRVTIDILRNYSLVSSYSLTRNVEWLRKETADSEGYLLLNELILSLNTPEVMLKAALANDDVKSREKTSSIVARKGALAGVNGGFFARAGGPLGLVIVDGEMKAPPVAFRPPRTAVGMSGNGDIYMGRLGFKDGKLADADGLEPPALSWAIGGGPRLLSGGAVAISAEEEALGKNGNDITRPAGRCAVGVLGKDRLLLLTATGFGSSNRQGTTLARLASIMRNEGAREAMCLDGGDSTNMAIKGDIVSNGPADFSPERSVGSMILVYDDSRDLSPSSISAEAPAMATADGESTVSVKLSVTDVSGGPVPDGTTVNISSSWGLLPPQVKTEKGTACFSFTALRRCADMDITARAGRAVKNFTIRFVPAGASLLAGRVAPSGAGEKGDSGLLLEVLARDRFYNPVPGESISFAIRSGTGRLEETGAVTGDDGIARVRFYPFSDAAVVAASCRELAPVTFTCAPAVPGDANPPGGDAGGGDDRK